ncbi:MAG: hypothetical protein E6J39_04595 [Chloroflexi bacterium]|nr:MAG: hypothetical protein E6J39_04595 [Chloroflexota bacterium]
MILHTPPSHSRFGFRGLPALTPDRVAAGLGRHLDDAYHYVRHPSPPGIDPIDAVVVGPGGTWALTVAHERGRFRKRNGHWYRWNGSTESWIPWDAVPITVARLAGHRLELFLERAGQPPAVEACLIAQDGTDVTWEADQRPGVHVHAVFAKLARRIVRDEVLSDTQVDRIVALLDPRQPLPRLAPSTPQG